MGDATDALEDSIGRLAEVPGQLGLLGQYGLAREPRAAHLERRRVARMAAQVGQSYRGLAAFTQSRLPISTNGSFQPTCDYQCS